MSMFIMNTLYPSCRCSRVRAGEGVALKQQASLFYSTFREFPRFHNIRIQNKSHLINKQQQIKLPSFFNPFFLCILIGIALVQKIWILEGLSNLFAGSLKEVLVFASPFIGEVGYLAETLFRYSSAVNSSLTAGRDEILTPNPECEVSL